MNDEKISMRWDLSILNNFIGMVFKKNQYITVSSLRNLKKLMDRCDYSMYRNKSVIMKRVDFIQKSLIAKLDNKMTDENVIITFCRPDNGNTDPVFEDIITNLPKYKQLNHSEIEFLNKFIEDRLQVGVIVNHIQNMKTIIERVEDGEYSTYADANIMVENWINAYKEASRNIVTTKSKHMISLNDPNIKDRIGDIVQSLGTTSSILITGIQMLNEMLSPGFRPGKLYVFLGLSGGFKSAMLLKIIVDCIRYNAKTYKPKKEGLKPCVLYLTMENSLEESFARLYNLTIGNDDIENHDSDFIYNKMYDKNILGNDEMEVILWYEANMSISTQDIRNKIDELESEGKEVALLSFDYIKRIKSVLPFTNEKEQLKNVTNELRTIAQDYLIPVVSAQQLNRSGLATVNAAARDNKADLARLLGAENVGTAYEVYENADMTIILNLERKRDTGQLYLTFFRVKERYRPQSKLEYFNQPFLKDNEFMLVDDIFETKPQGIISLSTDLDGVDGEVLFGSGSRGRRKHTSGRTAMLSKETTDELFDLTPLGA